MATSAIITKPAKEAMIMPITKGVLTDVVVTTSSVEIQVAVKTKSLVTRLSIL